PGGAGGDLGGAAADDAPAAAGGAVPLGHVGLVRADAVEVSAALGELVAGAADLGPPVRRAVVHPDVAGPVLLAHTGRAGVDQHRGAADDGPAGGRAHPLGHVAAVGCEREHGLLGPRD